MANEYRIVKGVFEEYWGNEANFTIPEGVKKIGSGAFKDCTSLINIIIPYGVEIIESSAFQKCTSLISVDLPNSLESLGGNSFSGCSSLTTINLPDSIISIDSQAFYGCSSLHLNLFDNATYLGNADNPCLALIKASSNTITSCDIHPDTKLIAAAAFCDCNKLKSIVVPEGVRSVCSNAFSGCTSLRSIDFPDSVIFVGYSLFYQCPIDNITGSVAACAMAKNPKLTSIVITNGQAIGDKTFNDCRSLAHVSILDEVKSIGTEAFRNCSSLEDISLPNTLKTIGAGAFDGCSSLTSLEIPNSIINIEAVAFNRCSSLQYNCFDNANYLGNKRNPYIVLISACDRSISEISIHSQTKIIYSEAFSDCRTLKSVTIPDGVRSIGYHAFWNCYSLKNVAIPTSITSIGRDAFSKDDGDYGSYLLDCTLRFQGSVDDWKKIKENQYSFCTLVRFGAKGSAGSKRKSRYKGSSKSFGQMLKTGYLTWLKVIGVLLCLLLTPIGLLFSMAFDKIIGVAIGLIVASAIIIPIVAYIKSRK